MSAVQEQKALDDYLSSLDAKELLKSFEKEKKDSKSKPKDWGSSLRKKLKFIVPEASPVS